MSQKVVKKRLKKGSKNGVILHVYFILVKVSKSAILPIFGYFRELFKKLSYIWGVSPRTYARRWSYSVYIIIVYP